VRMVVPRQLAAAVLQATKSAVASSRELAAAAAAGGQPLYLPDATALQRAGITSCAMAPTAAQSMLAVSLAADQSAAGDHVRSDIFGMK